MQAVDAPVPFGGEKSEWHDGFVRYDFAMDEETLAITPFQAPDGEKFGVKDPAKGQRRCLVIAPLAEAGVPLLHVCGNLDPAFDAHTRVVEKSYQKLGGRITVIIKDGEGHYPLAPRDPKPVVDFIVGKAI